MIEVKDLTKNYGGARALDSVSFQIADGESVGFLGLNGAGKTTALRIIACDLKPSSGSITIGDVNALEDPHAVRKNVGFLPERPPLYLDMTVGDYLFFAGRIQGMTKAAVKKRIPEVEEITHIGHMHNEIIRHLSHGYQQRVGVAQAIVHEPKLLILDEPTRGLDPVQIVEMRSLVKVLKANHTVLISSHLLPEISETCDRLLVLGDGKIVASGTETELAKGRSQKLTVTAAPASGQVDDPSRDAIKKCIEGVEGVNQVAQAAQETRAFVFQASGDGDRRAQVCKALVDAGHDVLRLDQAERRLEGLFLRIVQGDEKNVD